MGYPIALAGVFFLLRVFRSLGWRVRKPNVYVRSRGASFPNLTSINKMFIYEGASVGLPPGSEPVTKLPNGIVTTLEQRGGNFQPVPDPESA